MKMKKSIGIALLSLFLFTNCTAQKKKASSFSNSKIEKKQDDIIRLKEGQNIFAKKYQMNITFKKVIEDSRCVKKNEKCAKNGIGVVSIELMSIHSRPRTFALSTTNFGKYQQSIYFNGYQISLERLLPENNNSHRKQEYIIELKIKKHKFNKRKNITIKNLKKLNQKKKSRVKLLENYDKTTSEFRFEHAPLEKS
ncbi:MAG: hypothetical protein CSA38_02450 [Flavobacteriales bacterium]|nr:MAG: hypothetical protein CSA38_02450 [Flavobacteriales bacterium]